jgi:hypothetical protein
LLNGQPPAADAVRNALASVLGSKALARSDRARKLLRYLVEQEQEGQAERLKGLSIAIDVFGRAPEFDPSTDAVVRVQAGRLRELLSQYYRNEGAADPLRITIPRGSYIPVYEWLAASDGPEEDADATDDRATGDEDPARTASDSSQPASQAAPEPPSSAFVSVAAPPSAHVMRHVQLFWAAMGIVIAMLGFLVYRMADPAQLRPGEIQALSDAGAVERFATGAIPPEPAAERLPIVHISSSADGPAVQRVSEVLRTALSSFDTVNFVARAHDLPSRSEADDAIRFVFFVTPGVKEGSVAVELQSAASGKVLLSQILTAGETATPVLESRIASIVSTTVPVSGGIYGYIEQNVQRGGLIGCLLLADDYLMDQQPDTYRAAYRCFEKLARAGGKSPLIPAEMASLQLDAATEDYDYPNGVTVETALALAHKAVLAGPTSAFAHRVYGAISARAGTAEESIRWMRKAHELNIFDLSTTAAYGYTLVMAGRYGEGVQVMGRAVEATSAHPAWWDYGLFLGKVMTDDMDGAVRAAESLATAKRPLFLAARIISAHRSGDVELRNQLLNELNAAFPKFAGNPAPKFAKDNYPPELAARLTQLLREAGLGKGA